MRLLRPVLLCVIAAAQVSADTIVLKNGRRLTAGHVTEEAQRVVYETAQGSFTLPKSIVARVERDGPLPAAQSGAAGTAGRKAPLPSLPSRSVQPDRVVVDGQVNRSYLEELARQPSPTPLARELLVASFLSALEFEMEHGRLDSALDLARRGESAAPSDPRMLMGQALVFMQRQEYRPAREILLRARNLAPNSGEVWKFLGFVEYSSDHVEEAIKSWKKSLSLAPDPEVERLIERAQRETAVEERFLEANSSHFTLRFEGQQIPVTFGRELLATLESHFRDLERDLEMAPREPILVILYTGQAFYDVTQAPSWTGALFDGKIRVPVEGLSGVTPGLSSVLKHEMAHSFVRARSRSRCPSWLNEGLAQVLEGKSSERFASRLAEMYRTGNGLHLADLAEPFSRLDPALVPAAYATSLAAVEMLRNRQGLADLGKVLDGLAAGSSMDASLRGVFGLNLEETEKQLAGYLQKSK